MDMKKCKECGKLFVPKSTRSQYCDELHYRPCPVCSKLVEAKYLSDPARCCSKECQQVLKKQNKPTSMLPQSKVKDNVAFVEVDIDDSDNVINAVSDIHNHNISATLSEEGRFLLEDADIRTYVGRTNCKFIQGHTYAVRVSKDRDYGNYQVEGYYDLSDDKQCQAYLVQASIISFNQFFLPASKKIVVRK